jgi:hypothetical protein
MLIFFFLWVHSVSAQTSYIPLGQVLSKEGYEFAFTGRMWQSVSRFDTEGKNVKFLDGESFSSNEYEFKGMYGATSDFQLGAGLNFRQNQSTFMDGVNEINGSAGGLQAFFVQGQFALPRVNKVWQYTLELNYRHIPYSNDVTNPNSLEEIVLGDDGADASGGMSLSYISPHLHSFGAKVLYRRPGNELSNEINYQIEGALVTTRVALIGGVEGIYSLSNDPYTDEPETKPQVNTGATALFNSINREKLAPYAGLNLALGKAWRVELKGQAVISGRSTDAGSMYSISLARRETAVTKNYVDQKFKTYDTEANVTKISKKKEYVVIDRGISGGVFVGMRFDLFVDNYTGGSKLMARGVVVRIKSDQAILKITSRFSGEYELREGMTARGFK